MSALAPENQHPAVTRSWWLLVGALLGLQAWWMICTVPGVQWNSPRLAPSFALVHGLPIYALRDSGLQLGWFYGPGLPLWYAPLAWIEHPTFLLVAAGIWNVATYLLPLAWVLQAAGVVRERGVLLVAAAALLLGHAVTQRHFFFIHLDVVCFFWSTLACLALYRAAERGDHRWWHLAAFALAWACWTKQLAVALYPGVLWWVAREQGVRPMLRFGLWAGAYAAAVSLLVFVCFGAEEVLFNAVLVQLYTPAEGGVAILAARLKEFLSAAWVWVPLAVWGFVAARRVALPPGAARLNRLFWSLAVWQLPLGFNAAIKIGGGLNSVHSLHYAFLALLVLAAHALPVWRSALRPAVFATVASVVVLVPLANSLRLTQQLAPLWQPYRKLEHFVGLARGEPDRYYFPWNPLVTLIAERKIRPFDNALYCLWLAKLEPPVEKIRAAAPPQPIFVYEEPTQSTFARRYFGSASPQEVRR
jgi:hypothetical protein